MIKGYVNLPFRIQDRRYLKILLLAIILSFFGFITYQQLVKSKTNVNDKKSISVADKLQSLKSNRLSTYDAIRNQLSNLTKKGGIEGVIKLSEFALQQKEISIDQCHNLLHLVGHEAYDYLEGDVSKLILYGSNTCIASFQHGIEAQIAETRKDSIEILKKYCSALRQSYPGISCYHGAGHGYMRVLKDAHKSVAKCDELEGGPDNELWNCYRGVFSEYGNQVLGVDTDTGLPIPNGPSLKIDNRTVPLLYCQEFEEKYRDSCYSQLTKIQHSNNHEESLKSCLTTQYTPRMQEICINITAGVDSRRALSEKESYHVPEMVLDLPKNLKESYIAGFKETLIGFKNSGIKKDWHSFCSQFTDPGDQEYCKQTFQGSF